MRGLLLKDFYVLRQYGKTMLIMLAIFALISSGLDNPSTFFVGVIVFMATMMTITSFSYDALAKWDRYALSMPVTRAEIVGAKYVLSVILCLTGAVVSFLLSLIFLKITGPVEGFGMTEHFYSTVGIISIASIFNAVLIPLIFQFGVEKCRIAMIAIFAAPTAIIVALSKMGVSMPSETALIAIVKMLPILAIILYFLSFYLSVRIFSAKEI